MALPSPTSSPHISPLSPPPTPPTSAPPPPPSALETARPSHLVSLLHDLELGRLLCLLDHVQCLDDGKLNVSGRPQQEWRPLNHYFHLAIVVRVGQMHPPPPPPLPSLNINTLFKNPRLRFVLQVKSHTWRTILIENSAYFMARSARGGGGGNSAVPSWGLLPVRLCDSVGRWSTTQWSCKLWEKCVVWSPERPRNSRVWLLVPATLPTREKRVALASCAQSGQRKSLRSRHAGITPGKYDKQCWSDA